MTSLPMTDWPAAPVSPAAVLEPPGPGVGPGAREEERLLQAFRSFARVAGSLERSYAQLQSEVERLRRQLAEKDGELASKRAEQQHERARLLRILEGLPCGVLVMLGQEKIWKANPEALRLLAGSEHAQLPPALPLLPLAMQQLLAAVGREGGERELQVGESNPYWIAARHASLGEGMSVFILQDVTEHKCLEETQARLKRDQALAQLTAILAHEVRNPLASLELFAGLLAESGLEGEPLRWVEHLQAGLRSLAATVNNVLQFHSPAPPQFAPVEAARLLEWFLDFCGPLARQSGVTLSMQNRARDVWLRGDRHRLEQVLLNLVLNSLRAMPGGGWIELGGRRLPDGGNFELSLADTGPGIPAEHLARIFEPGFSTQAGEPGLGLAVCRRIVEQHGGSIRAESRPDRGTVFRLCLPLISEAGA